MTLRLLFIIPLLCTFVLFTLAQAPVTLTGKVFTSDGKPATGVTVLIPAKKRATTTNDLGEYSFNGIKPGTYTILITSVGLKPAEYTVEVAAKGPHYAEHTLKENHIELEEVVIAAGRPNKFFTRKSETVSKMPLASLENPQVYTTITGNLLKEQLVNDIGNALRNTPGLYKISGNRGINTDGATFYTLRGFRTEVSMIDGVPGQTNGEVDPVNIERIEVLKGPSATLFGGAVTSFGGLINVITKKPQPDFGAEFAYTTGSYGLNRGTVDVYGPIDKNKKLSYRLNGVYQYQKSWQDVGFRQNYMIAPALSYRVNNRLRIDVNAEWYEGKGTNASAVFLNRTRKFIAHNPDELQFNWNRSYTTKDITMKNPTLNARMQVHYKLAENWNSHTIISSNTRKSKGYYQYQFIRKANTDDSLERNISRQNTVNTALDIQQNFTGTFNTGSIKHRVLLGLDFLQLKVDNDNSPYIVFDFVNGRLAEDKNDRNITPHAVEAKLTASTDPRTDNRSTSNIYSAYAADVVNITDQLVALLSLRVDRFDSRGTFNRTTGQTIRNSDYLQTAVSPKFGLVYQLIRDRLSVFANYMNGFSNVAPVTQPLPDISGTFKPQRANQYEGGVKLELFSNKLNITASYYDIEVENMTRTEVLERDGTKYNITVQNGTQRSKGVEFEVIANPIPGLHMMAGYAYNDSKLTKSTTALEGRRPASAGPANLANAWVSYSIPKGKFKGVGVGGGLYHAGEHLTANSLTTGVFASPAYTLLNATAFYETRKYRIGVRFDNITDKTYFVGQGVVSPQLPATFTANLTVRL